MSLTQFIDVLSSPSHLHQLLLDSGLGPEATEAALIYMEENLSLDSEIRLFGIEDTEDEMVYFEDGVKYIQLFPVDYAIDLIKSDLDLEGKGYSNMKIATRLLEYRLRDA